MMKANISLWGRGRVNVCQTLVVYFQPIKPRAFFAWFFTNNTKWWIKNKRLRLNLLKKFIICLAFENNFCRRRGIVRSSWTVVSCTPRKGSVSWYKRFCPRLSYFPTAFCFVFAVKRINNNRQKVAILLMWQWDTILIGDAVSQFRFDVWKGAFANFWSLPTRVCKVQFIIWRRL